MSTAINTTAQSHFNLTKSDTVDADPPFAGLYIGTGGTVVVIDINGVSATYANVPNAYQLPVAGKRVMSTGTTASNIVGWR